MKTIKKWCVILWLSALMMFAGVFSASAEEFEAYGILKGYDSNGNIVAVETAFVIEFGEYRYVYTDIVDPVDDMDFYYNPAGEDTEYPMEFLQNQDGLCMFWGLGQEYSGDAFQYLTYPRKDLEVYVLYMGTEGWTEASAVITDLSRAEGSDSLYMEKIEGFHEEGAYFPAILVDGDLNCYGFPYSEGEALTLFGDEKVFNSTSSAGAEDVTKDGQEPSSETESAPETKSTPETELAPETESTPETEPGQEPGSEEDAGKKRILAVAVAITALVAIAGTVAYISRKKKSAALSPENRGLQTEEIQKQSADFCVMAIGGCLCGNAYPITETEITFGRSDGNTVQFPEDTEGVSRQHCKLFWHNGNLALMDCGSSCGTYLEGQGKLSQDQVVPIKYGDTFYLGSKENSFKIQ